MIKNILINNMLIFALMISLIVHMAIIANISFAKNKSADEYVEISLITKSKVLNSGSEIKNVNSRQTKRHKVKESKINSIAKETSTVPDSLISTVDSNSDDTNNSVNVPIYSDAASVIMLEKPDYPSLAREKGYEGVVILVATIIYGNVIDYVTIKTSSGYRILDKAAIEAVKRSKFNTSRDTVEIKYEFVLNEL